MLILEQVLETHFIRDVGPAPRSVLNKLAEAGEGASSSCTLNCARVPVEGGLQQDSRGAHAQDVQDRAPHCRRAGRLCGTQCVQLGALTVSLLMLGLAALQTAVMAWHTVKAKIGTSAKSLRRDARARYAGRKSWPHCKRTAEQVVITAPHLPHQWLPLCRSATCRHASQGSKTWQSACVLAVQGRRLLGASCHSRVITWLTQCASSTANR